ncbi:DUF4388 domain-containing protein [Candidatus Chlorohelix sp.]|uniref:DUF4388 domain-containing protein n=1 Tax=Candidatus Chlorohelix sp. TaxID=3139201 RepID=UPI00303B2B50
MALEGSLREFPVTDIIQMVSLTKQTGAAEIKVAYRGQPTVGRIYFRGGNVVFAELDNLPSMEALLSFFSIDDGEFRFITGEPAPREEIHSSSEMLMMQGIKRSDEVKLIRQVLPSDAIVPRLADNPHTVGGGSINLRPEEWKLLTFINGQDDIATISRKSNISLHNTEKVIVHLLQLGLVEKQQRNVKYILYTELSELAFGVLGTTAKNLIDQAYQRTHIYIETDITLDQAYELVANFQKLSRLLVGPKKSDMLRDHMRDCVDKLFNIR